MTTLTKFDGVLFAAPAIEMKLAQAAAEQGQIEGYASFYGGPPDLVGDIVAKGAYDRALTTMHAEKRTPAMVWAHDLSRPVGRWEEARGDDRGLFVKGRLNLETTAGREAYAHVKAGDLNGLSIGYQIPPGGAEFNRDGTRTLKAVDLYEVSLVTVPAASRARITGVKGLATRAEIEDLLRQRLPARAAKLVLKSGWSALEGNEGDDESDPAITELFAAVKAARLDFKGR